MDILDIIQRRQSSRVPFDPGQRIPEDHLRCIIEGARWAPTAHNMQNFQIVVVDDRALLDELSTIPPETSRAFIEETCDQLSSSEEELSRRKVGLLGTTFPPSWQTLDLDRHVEEAHPYSILGAPIYFKMSAAYLIVLYDSRKRAPASEGDRLGMVSLGCVMENMWLVAQSLGIGFQVQTFHQRGSHRGGGQADPRRAGAPEDRLRGAHRLSNDPCGVSPGST